MLRCSQYGVGEVGVSNFEGRKSGKLGRRASGKRAQGKKHLKDTGTMMTMQIVTGAHDRQCHRKMYHMHNTMTPCAADWKGKVDSFSGFDSPNC